MFPKRHLITILLLGYLAACSSPSGLQEPTKHDPAPPQALAIFQTNDVVAFLGGEDVAAAQHTGHLEALLSTGNPNLNLRFRNFGWEGDTVFAQPREIGFLPILEHLKRHGGTVVLFQFGRMESLDRGHSIDDFISAYRKLLNTLKNQAPRQILVTPPPFEALPDSFAPLESQNATLARYCAAIRDLAREQGIPIIDLFTAVSSRNRTPFTSNGLQLSLQGHALMASLVADAVADGSKRRTSDLFSGDGRFLDPHLERVRQLVISKNRLWFDYWRPQNWAFLGGDRTTQPSSRDHRDPNRRWFPEEMEKFAPLIADREREIAELTHRSQ